jgi:phytoene desaturase
MHRAEGRHRPRIVIIGAGVGGLAAGIRLAAQGCQVQIFERNERIGGKLGIMQSDGWTFDTGPSLLTMPDILRDLFAVAGASLDDMLELVRLDPLCRYVYPDGIILDAPARTDAMAAEAESFHPRDGDGFEDFMDYGRRVYDVAAQPFLFSPLEKPSKLARQLARRLNAPQNLARVLAPISLDMLVRRHFRDPHVRQVFDRYATYTGSSPFATPAVYAIIPYVEYAFGVWYPRGGMYQLAHALERLAAQTGVVIHTDSPVRQIVCKDAAAVGVELVSGEHISADAVISNVDVATTYRHMVPPATRSRQVMEQIDRLEPSLSGFVLLLGVNRRYDQLLHHNIYFSFDYRQEFHDIFERLVAPRDPTIYVCAATRTDPSQAPSGCENLFVQVNVPHLSREFSWPAEQAGYRELVLEKLERSGLTDLREHIVTETMITPDDMERRYGAQQGAIYGFSANSLFAPLRRPQNRARDIKNLYFAGGSVHPGGGLPLVMLSGKIAADLVAADVGIGPTP